MFYPNSLFCNVVEIDLNEKFKIIKEEDIIKQFKTLYNIVSTLEFNLDRQLIKDILSNLVNLGRLMNFTDEDIINGCLNKINRNHKRFETGF